MNKIIIVLAAIGIAYSSLAGTPPLVPAPQQVEWTDGFFDAAGYSLDAPTAAKTAVAALEQILGAPGKGGKITLRLGDTGRGDESYVLEVATNSILLTAPKPAGLFYGVQTLRQLVQAENGARHIAARRITDWPAFPLRGFMHDTGRNFQTLDSLKAQLDIFAAYKLNVFHWHLTDNPGWRIESKVFPQLNDPKFQTRDQGDIYTFADIRELIRYARDRHITILPELDMPGHSACFERAMGFKMGSEQGMDALEKIIDEFCREIPAADCPWLHLGSDEVHIKNPQEFMERMLKRTRANGREAFIWNPGLKGDEHTVMQLWQDEGASSQFGKLSSPFVDSAGGYLNWYDPLALVQRFFFRQPCGYAEQKWSFTFIPVKQETPTAHWIEDESVQFSEQIAEALQPPSAGSN